MTTECIFCKIIDGEIPSELIYKDDNVIAFKDLNPQAPTHLLFVPTIHVENAAELAKISPEGIADLFQLAGEIAEARGLNGYRTVFNTGAEAGQSVFHAHLHLLSGREFDWPPG